MNPAEHRRVLPVSIGGLVDLAAAAYAERARLYAILAFGVFAAGTVIEFVWPGTTETSVSKLLAQVFAQLLGDAFVVAAVALGIGARLAGDRPARSILLAGSFERWMAVAGALTLVQEIVELTARGGALGSVDDPLILLTAPVTWLLWGALALAGPMAALSTDRPLLAIITSFGRALFLSLRVANLGRLALVAFASVVPLLIEAVLFDVLSRRGVPHASYLASVPADALAVGPLAALQTVFALDFARRGGTLERPR